MGRVVPGCGKRFGTGESSHGEWVDAGFGAAGEHDVCIVEYYEPGGITDRMGAGSAGCGDSVVGATEGVFHGDMSGSEVDEKTGNKKRGDLFIALGRRICQ